MKFAALALAAMMLATTLGGTVAEEPLFVEVAQTSNATELEPFSGPEAGAQIGFDLLAEPKQSDMNGRKLLVTGKLSFLQDKLCVVVAGVGQQLFFSYKSSLLSQNPQYYTLGPNIKAKVAKCYGDQVANNIRWHFGASTAATFWEDAYNNIAKFFGSSKRLSFNIAAQTYCNDAYTTYPVGDSRWTSALVIHEAKHTKQCMDLGSSGNFGYKYFYEFCRAMVLNCKDFDCGYLNNQLEVEAYAAEADFTNKGNTC